MASTTVRVNGEIVDMVGIRSGISLVRMDVLQTGVGGE